MKEHVCVDCRELPARPLEFLSPGEDALYPGPYRPSAPRPTDVAQHPRTPRCATHRRAQRKAQKAARNAAYVLRTYGLTSELKAVVWAAQGQACICGRRPTREPDTDHDHRLAREHEHPEDRACEGCLRGLLCRACNTYVVGRYSAAQLRALADYIERPTMDRIREAQR